MPPRRIEHPIEPMDLANMRENGVRSLQIMCLRCRHQTILNVDHLPGDLTVPLFGPRMMVHEMRDHRRRCAAELAGARPVVWRGWLGPASAFPP